MIESLEGRSMLATTPNDPGYAREWGLAETGAPAAWDQTRGSRGVVVAAIDTGVDYDHPDLYRNIWLNQKEIPAGVRKRLVDIDGDRRITFADLNAPANGGKVRDVNGDGRIDAGDVLASNKAGGWSDGIDGGGNGYVDDLVGWDFADNDNDPLDHDGHGTHTAGTIAAMGDNGTGVTGVNWEASLMAVKIFDDAGYAASGKEIAAAIRYSADNGARVSNNSWGGPVYSRRIGRAIAYAGERGQLFVTAAGNDATNLDAAWVRDYPGGYRLDNILVVAATRRGGTLAGFSDYGPTRVDVAAPGSDVLSTYLEGSYALASGTSMAAPHAAGAAALVLSEHPELTAEELKARIIDGADQNAALAGTSVSGGELNVRNALDGTTGLRSSGSGSDSGVASARGSRGRHRVASFSTEPITPLPHPGYELA